MLAVLSSEAFNCWVRGTRNVVMVEDTHNGSLTDKLHSRFYLFYIGPEIDWVSSVSSTDNRPHLVPLAWKLP